MVSKTGLRCQCCINVHTVLYNKRNILEQKDANKIIVIFTQQTFWRKPQFFIYNVLELDFIRMLCEWITSVSKKVSLICIFKNEVLEDCLEGGLQVYLVENEK